METKKFQLNELSIEELIFQIENDGLFLQHFYGNAFPEHFKDLTWFWNKDIEYLKNGKLEILKSANKTYKSIEDWLFYCGGRNSDLWILSINN